MKNFNLLTEDRKENINLFKHIIDPEKYSKYSNQLNKVFSSNSYSKFFNDLTKVEEKKQITLKDKVKKWLNLTNNSSRLFSKNFDINKFKTKLKEMEEKELLLFEKRKKTNDKRILKRKLLSQITADKVLKIKIKRKVLQLPGVGVYSPQYDSIGKHTYRVTFEKQNFDDFNKSENKHKTNKKNLKQISNSFCKKSKTLDKDLKYNKTLIKVQHKNKIKEKKNILSNNNNKDIMKNISLNNMGNSKKVNPNKFKMNDALLFFQKLKRNKRNKSNNENNSLGSNSYKKTLSDQSTFNKHNNNLTLMNNTSNIKIKGNVFFDKNKKTDCYFEEMAKKNKSPPVGFYHPNYSSIFVRTTNIFFPSIKKNKNVKKKLINKVIANYNQTIKYELFNILNQKNINKK